MTQTANRLIKLNLAKNNICNNGNKDDKINLGGN